MENQIRHTALYIIICVMLLLTSCSIERSDNGSLDGLWQVYSIDTLATGGSRDMRMAQASWAFQGQMLEWRVELPEHADYFCRFDMRGDSLLLSGYHELKRDDADPVLTDVSQLRPFGISKIDEHFAVKEFTGKTLRLKSETLVVNLRKY